MFYTTTSDVWPLSMDNVIVRKSEYSRVFGVSFVHSFSELL